MAILSPWQGITKHYIGRAVMECCSIFMCRCVVGLHLLLPSSEAISLSHTGWMVPATRLMISWFVNYQLIVCALAPVRLCDSTFSRSAPRYQKGKCSVWSFDVLLTVHLSITLVNDQLDSQFFYFIIRLLQSTTCFEQRRAHHQEVKLY